MRFWFLCFVEIQYKMILSKYPGISFGAKTIKCLVNSIPRPAIFTPICLLCSQWWQVRWHLGTSPPGRQCAELRRKADVHRFVARFPHHPGGASGLEQGHMQGYPELRPKKELPLLGRWLLKVQSRVRPYLGPALVFTRHQHRS